MRFEEALAPKVCNLLVKIRNVVVQKINIGFARRFASLSNKMSEISQSLPLTIKKMAQLEYNVKSCRKMVLVVESLIATSSSLTSGFNKFSA